MLRIHYRGQERNYPVRKEVSAYSLRYIVEVEGVEVIFEQDEEGRYRALLPRGVSPQQLALSKELLGSVCDALETW